VPPANDAGVISDGVVGAAGDVTEDEGAVSIPAVFAGAFPPGGTVPAGSIAVAGATAVSVEGGGATVTPKASGGAAAAAATAFGVFPGPGGKGGGIPGGGIPGGGIAVAVATFDRRVGGVRGLRSTSVRVNFPRRVIMAILEDF